jgi:protein CpxP
MKSTSSIFKPTFKRLVLAASLAAALPFAAVTSAAYAQGMPDGQGGPGHPGGPMMHGGMEHRMHHGHHGHHGHGMPHFLRGINLTEAQRDKIFAIRYAQMPAMRDKMKALHAAHKELRGLATSAQYDDARAKSAAEAGARAMADLTLMRVRTNHEIYALLTPEQRAQAEQMKARMMEHHHKDGMDGRGGPGMAPKQ